MNKVNVEEFSQIIGRVDSFLTDLPRRIKQVEIEIDYCQSELQDLQHYIEFNNLSASQGWKLANEIKQVRIKRRHLKDELDYLQAIDKRMKNVFKHNSGVNDLAEGIKHTKEKHKARTYVPRVRKDLFE